MIDILANGVWSVDFGEAVKIKDARGDTIATVAQTFLRGRRSASEVSAIAHLIAAAPDLYEALVWAMGKITPPNSVCTDEAHDRFNFAMSAIAKAEGGVS